MVPWPFTSSEVTKVPNPPRSWEKKCPNVPTSPGPAAGTGIGAFLGPFLQVPPFLRRFWQLFLLIQAQDCCLGVRGAPESNLG